MSGFFLLLHRLFQSICAKLIVWRYGGKPALALSQTSVRVVIVICAVSNVAGHFKA
jgi:hypothetical protein